MSSLEAAADLTAKAGPAATDAEMGACRYWQGRVMWAMGGEHRSHRGNAHASFLAAAGATADPSL